MTDDRPDPDALLARVRAEESEKTRGRLKIFFGMAPGVGKTYAMLEAARKVAKEGADVIVGYVEPHARPETLALVLGLDLLPRRQHEYRGHFIEEFDLEGALARKPQIILVDELAHTNVEGSLHRKRWQDVEDLLAAGIDVFATLNVQHLESLNDVVAQVTTIPVRETVPDHVFENADEVELIDISPEDLIERLREGKVYVSAQAARAIENFFRKGNLFALREMALRKTAERVGSQARDYRTEHSVSKIWPTSERLLVCVGPSPMSARLIRATRRMAASLNAPWIALHVDMENAPAMRPGDPERLQANLRLAEELGATIATTAGDNFAETVLDYCRRQNITKIIAGKPLHNRWLDLWRGSLVYELIRLSGDIDIYVISGDGTEPQPASTVVKAPHIARSSYVWSVLVIAVCTALSFVLFPIFQPVNLVMVYLAGVVIVSLLHGRGPSVLATILGVAAFDLFFVPPYGTFAVADSQYLLTFAIMLVTGIVISELTSRVRRQAERLRKREHRTAVLFALSKQLSGLPTRDAVIMASRKLIQEALDMDVWILNADAIPQFPLADSGQHDGPPGSDVGVIRWVYEHGRPAGCGSDTLPGTATTYFPLMSSGGIVGVLGVRSRSSISEMGLAKRDLLLALASQVAGALERCDLARQAEHVRLLMETERLKNSLLSTVSHDLRTPLATIAGAAGTLSGGGSLSDSQRKELAESIVDESDRLNRLVANLLDLTRLEAGAIKLQRDLQPIEEVIEITLGRMDRILRDHHVDVKIDDGLPPVAIDGLLIQQVLTNLLDNAAKFSPPGSTIDLMCRRSLNELVIEVADRGMGVPAKETPRIFEKFYRAEGHSRPGSGIGLAICRGIVELHGGRISAENRTGGGTIFRVTLPLGELPPEIRPPSV
jgi:two-component system, OmpR family, sensor histidine kinase KdpD